MPRKKLSKDEKRSHLATVRLNDFEYDMVSESAKKAGMSISEYLRKQAVFGKVDLHVHIVADMPKLEKLTREFSAIGNNLNQLTQYFHLGGIRSAAMCAELNRCLNEIMKMREEVTALGGEFRGYTQAHLE